MDKLVKETAESLYKILQEEIDEIKARQPEDNYTKISYAPLKEMIVRAEANNLTIEEIREIMKELPALVDNLVELGDITSLSDKLAEARQKLADSQYSEDSKLELNNYLQKFENFETDKMNYDVNFVNKAIQDIDNFISKLEVKKEVDLKPRPLISVPLTRERNVLSYTGNDQNTIDWYKKLYDNGVIKVDGKVLNKNVASYSTDRGYFLNNPQEYIRIKFAGLNKDEIISIEVEGWATLRYKVKSVISYGGSSTDAELEQLEDGEGSQPEAPTPNPSPNLKVKLLLNGNYDYRLVKIDSEDNNSKKWLENIAQNKAKIYVLPNNVLNSVEVDTESGYKVERDKLYIYGLKIGDYIAIENTNFEKVYLRAVNDFGIYKLNVVEESEVPSELLKKDGEDNKTDKNIQGDNLKEIKLKKSLVTIEKQITFDDKDLDTMNWLRNIENSDDVVVNNNKKLRKVNYSFDKGYRIIDNNLFLQGLQVGDYVRIRVSGYKDIYFKLTRASFDYYIEKISKEEVPENIR